MEDTTSNVTAIIVFMMMYATVGIMLAGVVEQLMSSKRRFTQLAIMFCVGAAWFPLLVVAFFWLLVITMIRY